MTRDDVIDLIKDAGFGFLATVDAQGAPHVRPMMPHLTDDGELLFAVIQNSRSLDHIRQNPNVEISYVDRKMSLARLSGKAEINEDKDKKSTVWQSIPMLRQYFSSVDDPNFILVSLRPEKVEAMTPQQRQPGVIDWSS